MSETQLPPELLALQTALGLVPRGDELFYRSGAALLAATVRPGPVFGVLRRTLLFSDRNYLADLTHQMYDVAQDGRYFLMVRNLGGTSHLTVILNQFRNLSAAAP